MKPNEPLFVCGPHKTGTSTLTGILNCDPDIFMLYETVMHNDAMSRYAQQFLARCPSSRHLFGTHLSVKEQHERLGELLGGFRYCGDNIVTLDPEATAGLRTIYTCRDIRTWLCKEYVVNRYHTTPDVVPAAIAYLTYWQAIQDRCNSIIVTTEDLVGDNDATLKRVGDWLETDFATHASEWWSKVGRYSDGDPKGWQEWHTGRPSAMIRPTKLDTVSDCTEIPFWDSVSAVVQCEAKPDILAQYSPLPLRTAYTSIQTRSFGRRRAKFKLLSRWAMRVIFGRTGTE